MSTSRFDSSSMLPRVEGSTTRPLPDLPRLGLTNNRPHDATTLQASLDAHSKLTIHSSTSERLSAADRAHIHKRLVAGPSTTRTRTTLTLPRQNSSTFRRQLTAISDERLRTLTANTTRQRQTRDKRERFEAALVADWLQKKLSVVQHLESVETAMKMKVGIIDTVVDAIVEQVKAHTFDRGTLLEQTVVLLKDHLAELHSYAIDKGVRHIQNVYRNRMLRMASSQREDIESLIDDKKKLFEQCFTLRLQLKQTNNVVHCLQQEMNDDVVKRDEVNQAHDDECIQLRQSYDRMLLLYHQQHSFNAQLQMDLNGVRQELHDQQLDIMFAHNREQRLKHNLALSDAKCQELNDRLRLIHDTDIDDEKNKSIQLDELESSAFSHTSEQQKSMTTKNDGTDNSDGILSTTNIEKRAENHAERCNTLPRSIQMNEKKTLTARNITDMNIPGYILPPKLPPGLRRVMNGRIEHWHNHYVHVQTRACIIKWIGKILSEKPIFDEAALACGIVNLRANSSASFTQFVYDFHLAHHGKRETAELALIDLNANLELHYAHSARIRLFRLFLNESVPERIINSAVMFMEALRIYATGPFQAIFDNVQGMCWVDVESVARIVGKVMSRFHSDIVLQAINKLRNRSRTQSIVRQDVGVSLQGSKGTDQFMGIDDCLEIIVEALLEQDKLLSDNLHQVFAEYHADNIDVIDDDRKMASADDENAEWKMILSSSFSLHDFECAIRRVEPKATHNHMAFCFRKSVSRAHQRALRIDDIVEGARSGGILELPLTLEGLAKAMSVRVIRAKKILIESVISIESQMIHAANDSAHVDISNSATTIQSQPNISAKHTRILEERVRALREQVIDTVNSWRFKLQRAQEKHESVTSSINEEHEIYTNQMKEEHRVNRLDTVKQVEERLNKKMQMLFEKFERRETHFTETTKAMHERHDKRTNEFNRLFKLWRREKQDLQHAVEELSAKLAQARDQSALLQNEARQQIMDQINFLKAAITLRSSDLARLSVCAERAFMAQEDYRERCIVQTKRFHILLRENAMLRRAMYQSGTTAHVPSLSTSASKRPPVDRRLQHDSRRLVSGVPSVAELEFEAETTPIFRHQRQQTSVDNTEELTLNGERKISRQQLF